MSLLSAGKQITVGNQKAFGRGLFIADPEQAQRKARKQFEYQEELRIQMQQAKRRKQQQKRKQMEQDKKLQEKVNQQVERQKQMLNKKPNQKNDKIIITKQQQKIPSNKLEMLKVEHRQRKRDEPPPNYKFDVRVNTEMDRTENPYLPKRFDILQAQEQRFYDQNNTQRLRGMRQALQQKMIEVYKKIKQSQNLQIDKEIDLIRRKIASSNTSYDSQNPNIQKFQGEYSEFYRIPKKQNYYAQSRVKNLDYNSTSYKKKQNFAARDFKPVTQQKVVASRHNISRQSTQNEELWGVKKGKNNFLGNRQAIDLQLKVMMDQIDDKLDQNAQP